MMDDLLLRTIQTYLVDRRHIMLELDDLVLLDQIRLVEQNTIREGDLRDRKNGDDVTSTG